MVGPFGATGWFIEAAGGGGALYQGKERGSEHKVSSMALIHDDVGIRGVIGNT